MLELFLAFFVLALIMIGMALGIIMGKNPLKGSCGGVGAALKEDDYTCDLCEGDKNKCEDLSDNIKKKNTQQTIKDVAYEVSMRQ